MVPIVTPSTVSLVGGGTVSFTADQTVVWSVTGGEISEAGVYSAANRTANYFVTATNAIGETTTIPVSVTGKFPLIPLYRSSRKTRRFGDVATTPNQQRHAVARTGKRREIDLEGVAKNAVEMTELDRFHEWHYPDKVFFLVDGTLGESTLTRFNGEVSAEYARHGRTDWKVPVISARDIEFPNSVVVEIAGDSATVRWKYTGSERTRVQFRVALSKNLGFTPWDYATERTILGLETETVYEFQVVAEDGSASEIVTASTGAIGWGLSWGNSWGGE
jgi:hypothetical protein